MTEKGPDAFRTISEVAEDLDVPQHVLRFWETRFSQIRPMKRGGGRRYYRPDDVDLLRGIRKLLYGDGYTIKGVQRILKDRGVRHVIAIGQGRDPDLEEGTAAPAAAAGQGEAAPAQPPAATAVPQPAAVPVAAPVQSAPAPAGSVPAAAEAPQAAVQPSPPPVAEPAAPQPATAPPVAVTPQPFTPVAQPPQPTQPVAPTQPAQPVQPAPVQPAPVSPQADHAQPVARPQPTPRPGENDYSALPRLDSLRMFAHDRVGAGSGGGQGATPGAGTLPVSTAAQYADRPGNGYDRTPLPVRPPVAVPAVGTVGQSLSTDDIRRLQAVLYELSECRQLLTEALKR